MEWSKEKTLKLIELLQVNPSLWNPSLCDTRRDKQKRKEELRDISESLCVSISDANRKIQHLRTQYNRESAKEIRANTEDPTDRYVSNWYAYDYLHFLKDSSKPYRIRVEDRMAGINPGINNHTSHPENSIVEFKVGNLSPPNKVARKDSTHPNKSELNYPTMQKIRDEFTVFGEYIANELRSLRGEKNLLVAKKKIQDVIFEVKMGLIDQPRDEDSRITVYTHQRDPNGNNSPMNSGKVLYTTAIEHLSNTSNQPASAIGEIVINGACHYSNFKVDTQ